ncbi:alpha/beta hydrolase-fold protein [Marinomonas algicola]|uniref:alpha/beta hydrolase-fold protein n=1 Tax=Marinomonas algicola TaxID=2773454 RepID=UPI00174B1EB7
MYSKQQGVASGTFVKHRFKSELLQNERHIWLYRSADFDSNDPDATLLLQFDGLKYTTKVPIPVILDNLVASKRLPPIAAIFVDNASSQSRGQELPDNPVFARALVEEVLPWAKGELGISIDAQHTVLAGSSYGGLASSSVALRYPETFGNVLSMSGSYWWSPANTSPENEEYVAHWVASTKAKPIRFFLSAGVFESGKGSGIGLLESNRHLRTVLNAKGYDVIYKEYAAGHDYFSWQQAFAEGMLALFEKQ